MPFFKENLIILQSFLARCIFFVTESFNLLLKDVNMIAPASDFLVFISFMTNFDH